MTNHGESTGSHENGKPTGRDGQGADDERSAFPDASERPVRPSRVDCTAYDSHGADHQVTLRSPAELADALPYLLGYRPEDSIVLVALHDRDGRGRFGGRARLGIPAGPDDWASVAGQLAHGLVTGSERRGARPEQMVAYLCQEPEKGESGRQVMERLRPLAQKLRVECGLLDVPVIEALCISDGRFWSYCCSNEACCPPEGLPMGLPGTSVLAAAATYAGLQVRGTLRELRARLQPWETAAALEQESALDAASAALVPRILEDASRVGVAEETLELAALIMRRLAEAPPVSGPLAADRRDDELLAHDEAATLILGLQDRVTRDRAAEWMEGEEAASALRLWRALARRCVGPYNEHAAAPLTLAGWVAWSTGDDLEAREALAMALGSDPDYLFARLLHQACNEGLDPEAIRRCLRSERRDRGRPEARQLPAGEGAAEPGAVEGVELNKPVPDPVQSPIQNEAKDSMPGPAARSRRRTRQGSTLRGTSRSAKAEARGSGSGVPRQRTSASNGTRPGSARPGHMRPRTSGKGPAHRRDGRPGSLQPGSDGIGGET
ncbi:DUF4192 domain-containing protein [Streptomyces spinosirectus]|jgi:hypothetical protein|uniref:DUF4192 domain-containing protein n=1 Tax=Streptomyces TaxID=1883 RepID=UPI001C9D901D|nr:MULTISPECIES: DUF4192 domain-containing protein [Streptomyces]MBY8338780.1 DUF4192 domain-containing protein [Streptomyces plumbidurans]UIR20884.1 DUF4192 domain-containing protein [Streptomyces spinosirectus]